MKTETEKTMKRILFTFALLFALPGYADIVYQEDGGIVAVGVNAPLYVRTNALAASAGAVAVAQTGNTDLLQFSVGQAERVWIEVVCGGQALDAFIVLGRAHASGSWLTFAGSAAHYTAPAGVIVGASGDLTALAAVTLFVILQGGTSVG